MYRKVLDLEPKSYYAYSFMSHAYRELKQHDQAIAAGIKAIDMSERKDPVVVADLATTYALVGDRRQAEEHLQELMRSNPRPPPVEVAATFAALGQDDVAFEWLERAYHERQGNLIWLSSRFPPFARLGSDPRFISLRRRMHLKQ